MTTFLKIPEYLATSWLIFATFFADCYGKMDFFDKKSEHKFVVEKWAKTNFSHFFHKNLKSYKKVI